MGFADREGIDILPFLPLRDMYKINVKMEKMYDITRKGKCYMSEEKRNKARKKRKKRK